MHTAPHYGGGGDSNSEGGSRLLPSLRLAVEGRGREREGGEGRGEGDGGRRGGRGEAGGFAPLGAGMADQL